MTGDQLDLDAVSTAQNHTARTKDYRTRDGSGESRQPLLCGTSSDEEAQTRAVDAAAKLAVKPGLEVEVRNDSTFQIGIQVFFPFIMAGFGTVAAGVLLDKVQVSSLSFSWYARAARKLLAAGVITLYRSSYVVMRRRYRIASSVIEDHGVGIGSAQFQKLEQRALFPKKKDHWQLYMCDIEMAVAHGRKLFLGGYGSRCSSWKMIRELLPPFLFSGCGLCAAGAYLNALQVGYLHTGTANTISTVE